MLDSVSLSADAMPEDPAVVKDAKRVPTTLSDADLLSRFLPSGLITSQFRLKGVTCQTKFDYVMQAMSRSDPGKVLDLIRAPPATGPY